MTSSGQEHPESGDLSDVLSDEQFAELGRRLGEQMKMRPLRQSNDFMARINNAFADQLRIKLAPSIQAMREAVRDAKIGPSLQEMFANVRRQLPPMWVDLDRDEFDLAVQLAVEDGIATVWAPRPEVVKSLIHSEVDPVSDLVRHQHELLEDARAVLETVHGDEDLADEARLFARSLDAFEAGHTEAAQALATAVLTTAIHRTSGRRFDLARESIRETPPGAQSFREFRRSVVFHAVAVAIDQTDGSASGFNRHATIHHASTAQFTHANALAVVLLTVNLLAQMHQDSIDADSAAAA